MGFFKTLLGGALLVSSLAPVTWAQSPVYGQCGGQGWTGPVSCASGSCCVVSNSFYSQCIPGGSCGGGGGGSPTRTTSITNPTSAPTSTPGTGTGGNTSGCGKGTTITTGAKTITVNGKQRQYTIRVPENYNPNKGYRLIFGFHYRGGTMQDIATGLTPTPNVWNYYGLQKLAGESAILVAPQGLGNGWANSGGEDIAFVDAMINSISAGLCVNSKLIFATGFSYGAAMSYSIACSRATKFRAVAVIAGGVLSGCAGGNDPIPYLGMHGIQDGTLNISGGRSMRDRFVKNNGCTSQSPPEVVRGSLTHRKTVYSGCRSGYPVWWIASDSGHSTAPADGTSGENKATTWAPGETWAFFSQFN